MAEKVTIMKLKVDLDCEKCYKKVKKLLAKYPQIRDQKYDEKQNIVTITVVCCSPEKIRDKLCCKGGGSIKSIEIVEPPKPKPAEPEKKKDAEKPKSAAEPEKKKDAEKPKPKPAAEPEKKKDADKPKQQDAPKADKPKDQPKEKPPEPKPAPPPVKLPDPVPAYPQVPPPMVVPVGMMCYGTPSYEGGPGGPCVSGYAGPPQCYDGYYGRPVYDSYGASRPYYGSRCDQYFSDENASGCTIM